MTSENVAVKSTSVMADFIENSILDTIVPHASEIDLEDALRSSDVDGQVEEASLVPSIAQRQTLLFGELKQSPLVWLKCLTYSRFADELISVYVVLRTSYVEEKILKSYLSRLAIRLEAHAVHSQPQSQFKPDAQEDGRGTQMRELVFSDTVRESDDPVIVVQGTENGSDEGEERYIFVFWKLKTFLSRARLL